MATMQISKNDDKTEMSNNELNSQTFYHGTKANLKTGDLIKIGFNSNYGKGKKAKYIYLPLPWKLLPGEPSLPWARSRVEFI